MGVTGSFVFAAVVANSQVLSTPAAEKITEVADEFSVISAVRELSDGTVLVCDIRTRELILVDPRTHRRTIIGRRGEGPGEYGNPHNLWAAGTDSTILYSSGGKLQLLRGARFIESTELLRRRTVALSSGVVGVDRAGNILRLVGIDQLKPGEKPRWIESISYSSVLAVIRHSTTGRVDTIAKVRGGYDGPGRQHSRSGPAGTEFFELASGIPTAEQAVLFSDGRIAIALQNPYRVDWVDSNGQRRIGVPIREPQVAVTPELKRIIAAENRMSGAVPSDFAYWPQSLPPFGMSALIAGEDGRLYVRRTTFGFNQPALVDVIDPGGRRGTFQLPPRSRLVGTGARGIYVAIRDQDDVETLVLFRSPL